MPITVRCHACDARTVCPDEAGGRRVKCPRCGQRLNVPARAVPDWQAAPPPVRRAPALGPSPDDAEPPPQEPYSEPAPAVEEDDYEPEPWYYGFIERYVISCMWFGTILCILSFTGITVLCLVLAAGLSATAPIAGSLSGGLALFLLWIYAAVCCVAAVLAVVYGCSWLLLALDAARNLRKIRMKFRGQ